MGYLEGTFKSNNTVDNYRGDLQSFERFLEKGLGRKRVIFSSLTRQDLEKYHSYLKQLGLKTNTRRRKILTLRRLLRYLTKRKKISLDMGLKLPAPHKIERIPLTVSLEPLLAEIQKLPESSLIETRNKTLLWALAETGCQVSEVTPLRFEQWQERTLSLSGKSPRILTISDGLYQLVQEMKRKSAEKSGGTAWLFLGFNKFGPLKAPMTPRGVELLVRTYSERLGFPKLTPRTFRQSMILKLLREGQAPETVRKQMGLKSLYAFRVFEPLLE